MTVESLCVPKRDGRDKPGHDNGEPLLVRQHLERLRVRLHAQPVGRAGTA